MNHASSTLELGRLGVYFVSLARQMAVPALQVDCRSRICPGLSAHIPRAQPRTRSHMTSRCSVLAWTLLAAAGAAACSAPGRPGHVLDEAMRAHVMAADMKFADEDYFHDMDGGVPLTPAEIQGRNMWLVWTGGNDLFWDTISNTSFGTFELLKTISSHPTMRYGRDDRFFYLGLINEPCFKKPTGPDPARFGLWLDVRDPA